MGISIEYSNGQHMEGTRLTFQEEIKRTNPRARRARFLCQCGNTLEADIAWVRSLNTTSCGCTRSEMVTEKNTKHNHAIRGATSGAYRSWQAMHQRVVSDPRYTHVSICKRWFDFQKFFEDMGDRPAHYTIERKNSSGDYEPGNCIWADRKTQAQNTSQVVDVSINGETHSINEWCRIKGIGYYLIKQRRTRGMSLEDEITTPLNQSKRGKKSHDS